MALEVKKPIKGNFQENIVPKRKYLNFL